MIRNDPRKRLVMWLENQIALITGGYQGMRRASVRLFAREGATFFVAGRSHERGNALAVEINEAGGKAHFIELDVVNQDHWNVAVDQIKQKAGGLHILMNIVGSNVLARFGSAVVCWPQSLARSFGPRRALLGYAATIL
ncbi:SDR family NAD(P)-dependent oxidoreductase [Dyella sp. Tek66A03]|uniref:SDR family NAD(P)-dependent oxidoreductase n=1 Tax=Dyella sp. Tek66A03 TaxID=3458298 RepID=UPI00403EF2AE